MVARLKNASAIRRTSVGHGFQRVNPEEPQGHVLSLLDHLYCKLNTVSSLDWEHYLYATTVHETCLVIMSVMV